MELHKTPERTKSGFVLLDQNMRLVKPVNEYLDFQALRGRAENTLLAYGKDLKTFFEFLEQRKLQYDQVTANMIRDYVEYLRAPDVNTVYLFVESKRSPATINRMISTLHGFYGYHVSMYGIVNPVITEDINISLPALADAQCTRCITAWPERPPWASAGRRAAAWAPL